MRPQPDPIIYNPTSLHHAWFCKSGPGGQLINVFLLKASYKILVAERLLRMMTPGESVVVADRHIQRRQEGSVVDQLLRPGEKTLPKPNGDLLLMGAARSDQGARRDWLAGVKLGKLEAIVHLHGPRQFERKPFLGWRLGSAVAVDQIPLDSSQEFGGCLRPVAMDNPSPLAHHPEAPSGSGWLPGSSEMTHLSRQARRLLVRHINSLEALRAPAVQDPRAPHRSPFDRRPSVGLAPVPRWSTLRSRWLGDLCQRQLPDGRPCLPSDIDLRFFQATRPALQREGHFRGDEVLVLLGLLPHGRFEANLPGIQPIVEVRFVSGDVDYMVPRLDTVLIDIDRLAVRLLWRWALPASQPVRTLSVESMRLVA